MKYDVIVIGGGPAGMMAAGRAAELGSCVLLLEKNKQLGVKLLITGNGRCNITNKTDDVREMIKCYGAKGKFLFSAFAKFGVNETLDFFESRGLKIKIEKDRRAFPSSDKAREVCDLMINYLRKNKVEIRLGSIVRQIIKEKNCIKKTVLENGEELMADNYIIATGGKSYSLTGSSGDGYAWLKSLGHTIEPLRPALTPIKVKEKIVKKLEGLSLKNVAISLYQAGKKMAVEKGEAIFTADGLSGPIILDLSRNTPISAKSKIDILIDFKPDLDWKDLDKQIQNDFKEGNNKMFKNILEKLLPQKLIPVIIELAGISPDKKVNLISREERKILINLLKEFKLTFASLSGFEKAIVTAGGLSLREIDPRTMKSKIIDNLFVAGEVLDLDGPTGGYNLQIVWSTGYVAGESCRKE
jgi:hypothetical protein